MAGSGDGDRGKKEPARTAWSIIGQKNEVGSEKGALGWERAGSKGVGRRSSFRKIEATGGKGWPGRRKKTRQALKVNLTPCTDTRWGREIFFAASKGEGERQAWAMPN